MADPVITENQALANSPARQLLAALTRASQEMEKSVSESHEFVSKLNAELERVVSAQLDETSEQVEIFVHNHLDGLSAEKDGILSQLTELRQEELRTLQNTGKNLRKALEERLNHLVTTFRNEIDEHLQIFQEKLEQADKNNNTNIETTRGSLRERMPGFLSSMSEEIRNEKQAMEDLYVNNQQNLTQESTVSLNQLVEHCNELKIHLENEGSSFLAAVDSSAEKLIAEQSEKLSQRIASFSAMEQKAGHRIDALSHADKSYIEELPANFRDSCGNMAELQVGLHATVVKNLALQYRTEILW